MARNRNGKCGCGTRIVSNVVQRMNGNRENGTSGRTGECMDVCGNPVIGDPDYLSIFAPVIYDEIGINLCTTFDLGVDIPTAYPTAVSATTKVLNITYTYGTDNVLIDSIAGRPNCYVVTLSNLTVQFAVSIYDAGCRLLDVIYPTAVYLPSDTTADTYDEDTNPASVELEIFAPYGISYLDAATGPTPIINYIGFLSTNNFPMQGINLYAMSKLLNIDIEDSTITVGLTLVLQSLYYVGYNISNHGKIQTPKGSIIVPDNSRCLSFVAGDLLDLAIKPLELGMPTCEENYKEKCAGCGCTANCGSVDDTTVLPGIVVTEPAPAPVPEPIPDPTPEPTP